MMIETLFQIKTNGRKCLLNFNTYCLDVLNYSSMRSNCFIRAYKFVGVYMRKYRSVVLTIFEMFYIMRFRVIELECFYSFYYKFLY